MKTDTYTRFLLTVIAFCLTILTFQRVEWIGEAKAGNPEGPHDRYVPEYAILPLNEDGSVSVKLSSDEINVNIVGIQTSDELDINIDEIGGGYVSHGGPITVEIED